MLPILLLRALPSRLGLRPRQDAAGDHALPRNLLGRMVGADLRRERESIKSGRNLGLGASLLMVARKPA
jgi:hypothetical protein